MFFHLVIYQIVSFFMFLYRAGLWLLEWFSRLSSGQCSFSSTVPLNPVSSSPAKEFQGSSCKVGWLMFKKYHSVCVKGRVIASLHNILCIFAVYKSAIYFIAECRPFYETFSHSHSFMSLLNVSPPILVTRLQLLKSNLLHCSFTYWEKKHVRVVLHFQKWQPHCDLVSAGGCIDWQTPSYIL